MINAYSNNITIMTKNKSSTNSLKGPPPPCQILQPLQMNTLLFLHYFVISDILIGMFFLQQT